MNNKILITGTTEGGVFKQQYYNIIVCGLESIKTVIEYRQYYTFNYTKEKHFVDTNNWFIFNKKSGSDMCIDTSI